MKLFILFVIMLIAATATSFAAQMSSYPEKTTPVAADRVLLIDSENSNATKTAQLGNLPGSGSSSVPDGTVDGQVLLWATDQWVASTFTWGSITGTLSSQTDLQDALDLKANISGGGFSLGSLSDLTYQVASDIAATSIEAGKTYFITTVGTTDFTAIGASSSTLYTTFTATGAGTGTGFVSEIVNVVTNTGSPGDTYGAYQVLTAYRLGELFQPLDSDLSDLADGELTGSKVGGSLTATASKSADYTIGTDDADEAYGGIIYVTSAATITAPAVSAGMSFSVITIGDVAVSLDVNASDRMYLDGTALDDGDKATNTSTSGDIITCAYESASGWYCMSGSADGDKWTDGGQ